MKSEQNIKWVFYKKKKTKSNLSRKPNTKKNKDKKLKKKLMKQIWR